MESWPNLLQFGLKRSVYDHAAVILKEVAESNWGPKPFKFVNSWLQETGFKQLIEEEWRNHVVRGWSGYVFKEKLKHLRRK